MLPADDIAPTPIVADPLIFFFYGVLSPLIDDMFPGAPPPIGTYKLPPAPEAVPGQDPPLPPPVLEVDISDPAPTPSFTVLVVIVPNPAPAFLPFSVKGFIFPR